MNQTKMETAEKLFMSCQFDKAFPILEELAKENDLRKLVIESNSRALFFLGLLYRYGLGHVQREKLIFTLLITSLPLRSNSL